MTVPNVTWRMLPGKIAHIRLSQFAENADKDMRKALSDWARRHDVVVG